MRNRTAKRPNNRCAKCDCQFFDKSYAGLTVPCDADIYDSNDPVWKCQGCGGESARRVNRRRTNRQIAHGLWQTIVDEWEPTDDALDRLVAEGRAKSGVLLKGHVWDHSLRQLLVVEEPTRWELRYLPREARRGLAEAKALVERIETQQPVVINKEEQTV